MGAAPERVVSLITPSMTDLHDRLRVEVSYALGSYPPMAEITVELLRGALNDRNTTVRANSLRALSHLGTQMGPARDELEHLLTDSRPIVRARAVEAMASAFTEDELESVPEFRLELARQLAGNDAYNSMMANRAEIKLDRTPTSMESTCMQLLKSRSNWQVWEAVDAMAELNPRPAWATSLLLMAMQHPNGTVRAKAEAVMEESR